jgi:uncharacterized membrane protein
MTRPKALPTRYRDALSLRADLWRVPFLFSLAGLVFFLVTVAIDRAAARGALTLPAWVSIGGPDDARAILGALLGTVSTVLALIFSVALLVLSMAMSQFGPRMLNRFVRDGVTQVTIGLFLASFVHTLMTFVVTRSDKTHEFVPQLTLVCSVLLVLASFGFLVVFSHRIAMSIQTQHVVAHIVADLDAALDDWVAGARQHPTPPRTSATSAALEAVASRAATEGGVVRAWRTGFVQEVDVGSLIATAETADGVMRLLYRPGQFVLEDAPFCHVLPRDRSEALADALRRDVQIGPHRTLKQDIEFGIAQLVEIALRALSPAVNDTFTGLTCIDWLGDEMRVLAPRQDAGACLGPSGAVRLMWPSLRFARLVKAAFDQIRQAAAGNPAVSIRLLQTFASLAARFEDARIREPLLEQVDAVREAVSGERLVKSDRDDVEAAYRAAREALGVR